MITVVIPVYNSPKEVRDLLISLVRGTNWDLIDEVIIADDGSDAITKEVISEFATSQQKIRHLSRSSNLGFLSNVNDAFAQAQSRYVVLMNSDTIVPKDWDVRVVDAMESDPAIALACPFTTNATNLVIKPAEGQSWEDVDDILRHRKPVYPPCQPVVGFFLAIRRELFMREPLLDARYGSGYWEDTDLHLRSISRGFRNVVIDNLFVFHSSSSPSFSIGNDLGAINDANRTKFMAQWREEFLAMEKSVERIGLPASPVTVSDGVTSRYTVRRPYDVIFVLPAAVPAIGGISVVLELVDELQSRGLVAAAHIYGQCDMNFVYANYKTTPFSSLASLKDVVESCQHVISTSGDSHDLAADVAKLLNARLGHLAQGPEPAFNAGQYAQQISANYQNVDYILTVSPYMSAFVKSFGASSTDLPIGPSAFKYYPFDIKRTRKSVAVCLRSNPLKGTGMAISNALVALQAGFEVHTFGHEKSDWRLSDEKIFSHGPIHGRKLAALFSSVDYYIDCSYMEGLGLLPLEAAFCGAIPLVRHLNGLSDLLEDGVNCRKLPADLAPPEFFTTLAKTDEAALRTNAIALRNRVSIEAAADKLVNLLQLTARKPHGSLVPAREISVSNEGMLEENQQLRQQIEQIYRSTSWRVTEPLREVGRRLRKRAP